MRAGRQRRRYPRRRDGAAREKDTGQQHKDLPARAKGKAPANFSVTVPVWVHVITDGSIGNLTSQQINAQIAVLNDGFGGDERRRRHGFSFTLAGVTRTDNAVWYASRSAGAEHEMKKALKRGDDGTLNVYTTSGGAYLGWAYLPEITDTAQAYLDGIVIDWRTVPHASDEYANEFDEGDTLTHEAGHWLNLEHTFYGQCNKSGDFVDDTPPQKSPSSGCPEGQRHLPAAAGPRPDPQLHGLLRRRLHHAVHAGPVAADARRLVVLPGVLRVPIGRSLQGEGRHESAPRARSGSTIEPSRLRSPAMKIFLDTADIEEIRTAARWGILDGVTTNPTLYAKVEGASYEDVLREVCSITPGPVSAEVVADEVEGMLEEGRAFAKLAPNIVVKVPMSENGLEAMSRFAEEGIKTNCTLVFSTNQGFLAAKAGASLISPFVGRLDDINQDGMIVIRELAEIFALHDIESEILAASIRNPLHVTQAALAGAHIATMPFKVLQQMVHHPLTDKGIVQFKADWEKARQAAGAGASPGRQEFEGRPPVRPV